MRLGVVQAPVIVMNKFDIQDFALRALILIAGGVAAALLALNGQAQALPALAVGGMLGAFLMRTGTSQS
jgi:hypothetical protein